MGLRPARGASKTRDYLVENQEGAVALGHIAQFAQEPFPSGHQPEGRAGRLDDHARNGVVPLEDGLNGVDVVRRAEMYRFRDGRKHASWRRAVVRRLMPQDHVVVPAVEMALKLEHLVSTRKGAGKPERHQRRFRPRARETDTLRGRNQALHPFPPFHLQLVARPVVGAPPESAR